MVWAFHPTTRNVVNLVRNAALAWRVLRRYRPDVVVSNGTAIAVAFFPLAKLLGIRTVYIEDVGRVDSRSVSGRICYPMSDLFVIQLESQRAFYPRAELIGRLL